MGINEFADTRKHELDEKATKKKHFDAAKLSAEQAMRAAEDAGVLVGGRASGRISDLSRYQSTPFIQLGNGKQVAIREERRVYDNPPEHDVLKRELIVRIDDDNFEPYAKLPDFAPIECLDPAAHANGYDEEIDLEIVQILGEVDDAMQALASISDRIADQPGYIPGTSH